MVQTFILHTLDVLLIFSQNELTIFPALSLLHPTLPYSFLSPSAPITGDSTPISLVMSSQKPKTIPDISLQLIPQLSYYKVLLILPPESFFNLSIFLQLPCNHLSSSYQCPGLNYSLRTDSYGILTGLQVSTLTFLQTIFQTAPDALLKMLI